MSRKPMQFWINEIPVFHTTAGHYAVYEAYNTVMEKPENLIHVIEYSAVQRLETRIEKLREALKNQKSAHELRGGYGASVEVSYINKALEADDEAAK